MNFGDKVKHLREAKKFSQSELGRRIGVSSRTIASYEAG
ncbi:MAG: helix-turn-helix domain-containing protein, partial [Eubacteriales bacterium]